MKTEIISQYRASLSMLLSTIKKCPEALWENDQYENAYWRIVYHTLFYTALYLSPSYTEFNTWTKHKPTYNSLGTVTPLNEPVVINEAYTKDDMIEYLESIFNDCENFVNNNPLEAESGFYWLPMNKFELHIYNIRHIHHHIGQLIERLHQTGITGIEWKAKG